MLGRFFDKRSKGTVVTGESDDPLFPAFQWGDTQRFLSEEIEKENTVNQLMRAQTPLLELKGKVGDGEKRARDVKQWYKSSLDKGELSEEQATRIIQTFAAAARYYKESSQHVNVALDMAQGLLNQLKFGMGEPENASAILKHIGGLIVTASLMYQKGAKMETMARMRETAFLAKTKRESSSRSSESPSTPKLDM